jgi:hypothetical protein
MPPRRSPEDPRLQIDKRALATLLQQRDHEFSRYSEKKVEPPTDSEIAYAKSVGYFFDPIKLTHDELIDRLYEAKSKITKRQVADAFVAGIGRKRLDWCSAIGSLAIAVHFPKHPPDFSRPNWPCLVCEMYPGQTRAANAKIECSPNNAISLRFEIGGFGFNQAKPSFATFDLEHFAAMAVKPVPENDDIAALRALIESFRALPPEITPSQLIQVIGETAGKNKYQRQQTIETLSTIGVLEPVLVPSFWNTYTPFIDRPTPSGKNDWAFPAFAWRGRDGVNDAAVKFWFGHLLE